MALDIQTVNIRWMRFGAIPAESPLVDTLTDSDLSDFLQKADQPGHPCFQLEPDIYIEVPPADWGHGDYLVYLPERNIMVRRNYVDYWYIDVGLLRWVEDHKYCWTDLWLDVVAPEPPVKYIVLDSEELADALRRRLVSIDNAALALKTLNSLLTLLRDCRRSLKRILPEVGVAEAFYNRLCSK